MTPLATLAGGWLCLAAGVLLSSVVPAPFALCAALALGNAWLFSARGRPGRRSALTVVCCAVCAGLAAYPGAAACLEGFFALLGWRCPSTHFGAPVAVEALCGWFLAPCFEEGLYRGRLFDALSRRFGGIVAVLFTSALFAIAHVERCAVFASFLIGCGLGLTRRMSGSLSVCIGAHCGLNLGATFWPRWWIHG